MSNMEIISKAKQAGNRLRQIRMANGMTQKEVADKVGLTDAAISKYEKNGIPGIDDIQRISEALQEDLLSDTRDVEGSVGEIGKEILRILIENKGEVTMKTLVGKLYGLNDRVTSSELGKLERIGLCMREQYLDFQDIQRDKVFITAKGVITFKNNVTSGVSQQISDQSKLSKVVTYEEILAKYYQPVDEENGDERNGYDSYEELINSRPIEKLVRQHDVKNGYKFDFIKCLQRHYVSSLEGGIAIDEFHRVCPGETFYADTIHRMIVNLERQKLDDLIKKSNHLQKLKDEIEDVKKDIMYYPSDDLEVDYANIVLSDAIPDMDDVLYKCYIGDEKSEFDEFEEISDKESFIDELEIPTHNADGREYLHDIQKNMETVDFFRYDPATYYIYRLQEKEQKSPYPTEWFSLEECTEYVRNQMLVKDNDEYAQKVDELIQKAFELDPKCKEYFRMPEAWIESGLAQEVLDYYGVC